jgi:hypothetical protein
MNLGKTGLPPALSGFVFQPIVEQLAHVVWARVQNPSHTLEQVVDLIGGELIRSLIEKGAPVAVTAAAIDVGGRITETAHVVVGPPISILLAQIRLIRYVVEPTFAKGKHIQRAKEELRRLAIEPSFEKLDGAFAPQVREVMNESPAKIRGRVSSYLRAAEVGPPEEKHEN